MNANRVLRLQPRGAGEDVVDTVGTLYVRCVESGVLAFCRPVFKVLTETTPSPCEDLCTVLL